MSETAEHSHPKYVKIWGILMVLLVLSILGPMVGIKWVVLITAFGIAVVKALMVAAKFMHLNVERRYIWFLLFICLAFLGLFFIAVAPDIMKSEGQNWERVGEIQHAVAPAHHD